MTAHDASSTANDEVASAGATSGTDPAGATRVRRRDVLRGLGAGALATTALWVSAGTATALDADAVYENPLYGPDFADPTIHRAQDGTWWAYASNMNYNDPADERLVPVLSSTDLVDWTYRGEAFASRPGWVDASIWAPDVHYHDGQWVLFYSVWPRPEDAGDQTGIGVATASSPDGPFTDHGRLFTNPEHPFPGNTIDPYFVHHEGTPYLFWGNFSGVYYVELTPDLQASRDGTWGQIAGSAYEGSTIFERDGYWYYLGATGDCCAGFDSTYEVEVARAQRLLGPYEDREGTPLLERDEWNAGPTHLGDNDRFVAPGHGDVTVADDGTYWFVYHAYDTTGPENADPYGWPPARQLFLDRIYWTDDGWPVIGGDGTPSASAPAPNLGDRSAPVADGTYRLINVQSGLALGVDGTGQGASAVLAAPDGGSAVDWSVTRLAGGEYLIENAENGLSLEVADADTSDGADVQQWTPNGHPTQRWYLVAAGDGSYQLVDACWNGVGGRSVAEVANASTEPGATVQQWTANGGDHQRWRFEPADRSTGPPPLDGVRPGDVDGDGFHEDFTGNGEVDNQDVVTYFQQMGDDGYLAQNREFFDYTGNGDIDYQDLIRLFGQL